MTDPQSMLQVAVGLAVVCYGLYEGWKRLPSFKLPSLAASGPSSEQDRQTVLSIQGRLKAAGNATASNTAYKLLGEMLDVPKGEPERKKL